MPPRHRNRRRTPATDRQNRRSDKKTSSVTQQAETQEDKEMLEQELNATTTEAQPNRGNLSWAKKNETLLKGLKGTALIGSAAATGTIAGKIAAAASIKPPPPNDFTAEVIAHAKENAVTVYSQAFDANGAPIPGTKAFGSGWFIEGTEGRLIGTAEHVLTWDPEQLAALNLPDGAKFQYWVVPNEGELAGQQIAFKPPAAEALDAKHDVAIVDLGRETNYAGLEIAPPNSVEIGDSVGMVGTPGYAPSYAGTFKQVTVSTVDDTELVLDGYVHHGYSGSLLIDGQGRVIGINTSAPIRPFGPDRDWDGTPDYYDELSIGVATRIEPFQALLDNYRESEAYKLLTNNAATHESASVRGVLEGPPLRVEERISEETYEAAEKAHHRRGTVEEKVEEATNSDAIDAIAATGSNNAPLVDKGAFGTQVPQFPHDNRAHEAFDLARATGGESSAPLVIKTSADNDITGELTRWHRGHDSLHADLLGIDNPAETNNILGQELGIDDSSKSLWDLISEAIAEAA